MGSLAGFTILGVAASPAEYTNPVVAVNSPDPGVLSYGDDRSHPSFVAVTSSGFSIVDDVFPIR